MKKILTLAGAILVLTLSLALYSGFVAPAAVEQPILFVSRTIPCCGSVYMADANALPGVGNFSKYQVASPGFLCLLNPDGSIDTLVDGSDPRPESLNLVDISAPCLSWDATKVVFAGLPHGPHETGNHNQVSREHDAWRIYMINIDGTGLRQVTGLSNIPGSDERPDLLQFSPLAQGGLRGYDDTDPIWLPDGRICFSSTRFPTLAMYNATRASNLYVVNEDGTHLHRITSEKNGADRPVVDPLTGKIVYARWWRNFYWPYDGMESVPSPQYPQGWKYHSGLTSDLNSVIDGEQYMFNNNAFVLTEINPDGSGQKVFSSWFRATSTNSCYGGSFDPDGHFIGNWFPIEHSTESSGFGGIKRYFRHGKKAPEGLVGITEYGNFDYYLKNPPSYGILVGEYAAEPFVLEDGRILFSKAPNPDQDYGLYIMDADGRNVELLLDIPGMTELRAQAVRPKPVPPIVQDIFTERAGLLPPKNADELRQEGTFIFDCRNIYYNAPVDDPVISAPKVGDVGSVRFFAAPLLNQQYGSIEALDWPIQYNEIPVDAFGRVLENDAPANVPLFEQARSSLASGYLIPRTGGGIMDGAAQVMGFNFSPAGQTVNCVGCHNGHSRIEVPRTAEELLFTNLAPGATIQASSAMNPPGYAIDRKNFTARGKHWFSTENADPNTQWLELQWLVPIWADRVVLHNIPAGFEVDINRSRLILYTDSTFEQVVFQRIIDEPLSDQGTVIELPDVTRIQSMRLEFLECKGGIYHWDCAAIGDIEVIASHVDPERFTEISDCMGIAYGGHQLDTCGRCLLPNDPLFNDCSPTATYERKPSPYLVFPNPASSWLSISGDQGWGAGSYRLLSLSGQVKLQGELTGQETRIALSGIHSGIYLLELRTGVDLWVTKVLVSGEW